MKYTFTEDWERGDISHTKGDVVYLCKKHDYGCAGDDTYLTKEPHVSCTLETDGDYPFFTVPTRVLEDNT